MRLFDKRIISHFDYLLIIFVLPLIFLSYHLIGETNEQLANKQLFYYSISLSPNNILVDTPILLNYSKPTSQNNLINSFS